MGVDPGGAGDQGLMFGYACSETESLMPLPITLAHDLCRGLSKARREGVIDYLRPDGKSQVTVEYEGDLPIRVDAVVVSSQHGEEVESERIREDVIRHIIRPIVPEDLLDDKTHIYVNPTGRFVTGGPHGDAGVTSYMARYVAKNCVAAGLAERVQLQLAYAIGVADPVSVLVDTFGTAKVAEDRISQLVRENFDLTPKGIIKTLDLRRPIYRQTAAFGHFWERTDVANDLRQAV